MNMTAPTGRAGTLAQPVSLGWYGTYAEAQRVVDYLADHYFDVQQTQIVGSDLRMVEQITGRLTWPRALLSGAASGAWWGLFVGVLLSVLTNTTFLAAMAWGLSWGVAFGGIFAAVKYGLTGGRRDFTSRSATVPSRFEVLVAAGYSDHAHTVLASAALESLSGDQERG
jgi:Heat induced stress protein YflT domain